MSYVNLLEIIYPIGSIYISCNDTSPAEIVGGTWSMVPDAYFLMASNTARVAGSTGGANSVTLSVNQIPSHNHRCSAVYTNWVGSNRSGNGLAPHDGTPMGSYWEITTGNAGGASPFQYSIILCCQSMEKNYLALEVISNGLH